MSEIKYYVVKKKALPDVLLKVVEAKRYLESGKASAVNEATEMAGISRSSFYKYKDDIFPFHENVRGKTITFVIQMDDIPGILSVILQRIASYQASILTIHQTIPINGVASLTLSVDLSVETTDCSAMLDDIEKTNGVHYLKLLGRE